MDRDNTILVVLMIATLGSIGGLYWKVSENGERVANIEGRLDITAQKLESDLPVGLGQRLEGIEARLDAGAETGLAIFAPLLEGLEEGEDIALWADIVPPPSDSNPADESVDERDAAMMP